eukprot:Rmarinus@m.837
MGVDNAVVVDVATLEESVRKGLRAVALEPASDRHVFVEGLDGVGGNLNVAAAREVDRGAVHASHILVRALQLGVVPTGVLVNNSPGALVEGVVHDRLRQVDRGVSLRVDGGAGLIDGRDAGGVQGNVVHAEVINRPRIHVVVVVGRSEAEILQLSEVPVLVGTVDQAVVIHEHGHGSRSDVLRHRHEVPPALILVGRHRIVDAVVRGPVVPGIPVSVAIAPGEMGVDNALGRRGAALEDGVSNGLRVIAIDPHRDGDLVGVDDRREGLVRDDDRAVGIVVDCAVVLAARRLPRDPASNVAVHGAAGRIGHVRAIGLVELVVEDRGVLLLVAGGGGVGGGRGHHLMNLLPRKRTVVDAEVVHGASEPVAHIVVRGPEAEVGHIVDLEVLVSAIVEDLAIEVDLHHPRAHRLREGPVVPRTFIDIRGGDLVDAVIGGAAVTTVPVHVLVAPREVHVKHAVGRPVTTFEEGVRNGVDVGAIHPHGNGDLLVLDHRRECFGGHHDGALGIEVESAAVVAARRGPLGTTGNRPVVVARGIVHSQASILVKRVVQHGGGRGRNVAIALTSHIIASGVTDHVLLDLLSRESVLVDAEVIHLAVVLIRLVVRRTDAEGVRILDRERLASDGGPQSAVNKD